MGQIGKSGFKYRIGCDVGGTFTDSILYEEDSGKIFLVKIPSTLPPEVGVIECIRQLLSQSKVNPAEVGYVCHATTIAVNAIIGQEGLDLSKTALVTTSGFEDILAIGRQIRPELYNFFFEKPPPLIPKKLRFGVKERIAFDGAIIEQLDRQSVQNTIMAIQNSGIKSVAICTLFSFLNDSHEKELARMFREDAPDLLLSISSELLPEYREYERMSTTVINAVLLPLIGSYLTSFELGLRGLGITVEPQMMQIGGAHGGTMGLTSARKKPVSIVEGGPAAGAIASAFLTALVGSTENIVSFDMGGTTAKAALLEGGQPLVTTEYEVGGLVSSGRRLRGSGYPVKMPVVDLVEIGAGGGSIAWIDSGGGLRVGPQSVGANPGPASYGRGGTKPTITDAYLALGVLDPEYFLGGQMSVSLDLARRAVDEHIAKPLGVDTTEAAGMIAEIANLNMLRMLRIATIERGKDPRDFDMVAFGGAGPLVAGRLLEELELRSVFIPWSPGLFSAFGLMVANIGRDFVSSKMMKLDNFPFDEVNSRFENLEQKGLVEMSQERVPKSRIVLARSLDMRFVGQSYELNIPCRSGKIDQNVLQEIANNFISKHRKIYGHAAEGEPIEIINLRVSVTGIVPPPQVTKIQPSRENAREAIRTQREIYFRKINKQTLCPVYTRSKLLAGDQIVGPAVIEQPDSTTTVYPEQQAQVDEYGLLRIEKAGSKKNL
ncbi:MAG: hydantoinase/oxoprolinase family protein [Nitrososphaerales archaeon]